MLTCHIPRPQIDNGVNSFLNKEGVPSAANGFIDKTLNSQVDKYL